MRESGKDRSKSMSNVEEFVLYSERLSLWRHGRFYRALHSWLLPRSISDSLLRRKNRDFIEKLELDEYGEVPPKPSINWKRLIVGLLWILLFPLLILLTYLMYKAPQLLIADNALKLTDNEWLQRVNEARATLVQTIGGLILIVGLFFTWRTVRTTEKNLKVSQEATAKNLEIAQEGLVTQRFSRAIELLGSDKLGVRLGGIYALERVARESRRDHWPIMEILTAFARENASWKHGDPPQAIRTDVQAVLTVLGRRNKTHEAIGMRRSLSESRKLDLRSTNLQGADLFGADFAGANFTYSNLSKSKMLNTNLQYANLNEADLSESHITGSNLKDTKLSGTRFDSATLFETKFDWSIWIARSGGPDPTSFEGAQIQLCSLRNTKFPSGCFRNARFLGGSLDGAQFEDASSPMLHLSPLI